MFGREGFPLVNLEQLSSLDPQQEEALVLRQRCSHYRGSHWSIHGNKTYRKTIEETQTDKYTETYSKNMGQSLHIHISEKTRWSQCGHWISGHIQPLLFVVQTEGTLTRLTSGGDRAGYMLIFILLGSGCQTFSKS